MSLLRPNIHVSIFLQMKQILESHVRCFVFTLWLDRLGIVQQVGVKFYISDSAARKLCNIKLVCFMYLLVSLMLHVKHHKSCLNWCECLVQYPGVWSQQLYGLRMRLGLHVVYYISEGTRQICPSSVWKTNFLLFIWFTDATCIKTKYCRDSWMNKWQLTGSNRCF